MRNNKALRALLAFVTVLVIIFSVWMGSTLAQAPVVKVGNPAALSYVAGVRDSRWYAYGFGKVPGGHVVVGNSATGSQTITVCPGIIKGPDGRAFNAFGGPTGTSPVPFTIDAQNSSVVETLTPSAVSLIPHPASDVDNPALPCANITATFVNLHAASQSPTQVISGDQGIQEAINDAALNGGGKVFWVIDPGSVTLATGAANTNLGSVSIPTRSVVESATARVTTTIATCAGGWSLGWSTGTEFTAANTTLTSGTTTDSSTITLPAAVIAATIPINKCTTSNASAGAIHAHFEGFKVVAPAN